MCFLVEDSHLKFLACFVPLRASFCRYSESSKTFLIDSSRSAAAKVSKAYDVLKIKERFRIDEFEGGHEWSGAQALDWMNKWL